MNRIPPGALDGGPGVWTYLIPLLVLGIAILRNSRTRTLRVERLWISPAIVMALAIVAFSLNPPPGPLGLGLDLGALSIGVLLGWWRGRASRFTVDPETHVVTSKVSPAGMLIILGIFALRYALRGLLGAPASPVHITAAEATDSLLLLAVAVVSAQRLEWWIRARRMIAEARAG
jgi:hypothetical protein